jgi:preprotein translocase subunit SecE
MDKTTRNILTLTLVGAGILVWFSASTAVNHFVAYLDIYVKAGFVHFLIVDAVPALLGALTTYILYRSQKIRTYLLEVITEVKKVVWPNKKETWGATVVVIIAVLISGVVLGLFDWISGYLIKLILG